MTVTISFYDEDNFPLDDTFVQTTVDNTNREILYAWQDNGLSGSHPTTTGLFYTNGSPSGLSGDTFVYSISGQNSSVQVTGNLTYHFGAAGAPAAETHILYGSIDSITIGAGSDSGGNITSPAITYTFDTPIVGTLAEGRANDVHDVIWGLMNGSVTGASDSIGTVSQGGLINALEENGLDVDVPFDSVADVVGLSAFSESELLLAA
ncbi:heme acquisition protein HasA [Sphingobium aquiterrae]|uniref:heme acquisition protein HasA n=1 Tax=Sphingobium aquiterrae TaxID=2038656 RepID=UPI003019226C